MSGLFRTRGRRLITWLALAVAAPFTLATAQGATAIVEGRVTDAATSRPLENVQVTIDGTTLGAATNAQGNYRITAIPVPGGTADVVVRVRAIGYSREIRTVSVSAGQTTRRDFNVTVSAVQLNQVVVTGSGQKTEVKRLGNTVAIIIPPANAPINDISNLLTGREPGLTGLVSGGLSGEGAKIRIRGNASLSQSNEPIIFLDGVRINSGGGYGIGNGGGGSPSRIDDIDPSTIERVEVLKGAAAATLYGTEASNGVIQFFTKTGSTGAPRWSMQLQQDAVDFGNRVGANSGYARTQARADSLATYWNKPGLKAFEVFEVPVFKDYFTETGTANVLSTSVQGGGQAVTYFASGRYYYENGPFGGADLGPARDNVRRIQTSANLSIVPTKNLRLRFNNAYYNTQNKSPENNNNIFGVNSLSYMARPELANCNLSSYVSPGRCSGAGNPFGNQAFATAREAMQVTNETGTQRYVGTLDGSYTAGSRLTLSTTFGFDYAAQRDFGLSPFGYNVDLLTANNADGARQVFASGTRVLTLDSKAAYNRDFGSNWTTASVVGLQVFNNSSTASSGGSTNFPGPGIEVVSAGGLNITAGESFLTTVNGGYFAQSQLGWRDWIFGTVGGRYDFSSAFGKSAGGVLYPKVSLSVVLSDRKNWTSTTLSTFRLRGALGQSGRQPGAFDQFTTFSPLVTSAGAGLLPSQLGNPDLKPEISTELEGGFEAGLFQNRVALEFTAWKRTVSDALVPRLYATSGGFRNPQLTNIGEINANGLEVALRGSPIQKANSKLDLFVNGAYLNQTLASLGGAPPIRVSGGYARLRVYLKDGAPLGSLYEPRLASQCGTVPASNSVGKPIACYNAGSIPINFNGRGTAATRDELLAYFATPRNIQQSAVQNVLQPLLADYDGSGILFEQRVGKNIPTWTGAFGGTYSFRQHWKIQSTIEYRTGYMVSNLTDGFRLSQHPSIGSNRKAFSDIQSVMENPASTPEQRVTAAETYISQYRRLLEPGLNQAQNGSFMRWRELAVTYDFGANVAKKLGFRNASATIAGRNIFMLTRYPGQDPESNDNGRGSVGTLADNFQNASDAFGLPIPRRVSLAINLNF
ncbi:SusC/RagA family TonB-linked outer membrane protein [Gemmatimonas sp.]|uniref:SusC/RagA family TonB-linked outer membrane protein n=1 Tax=Gemmatimonas sp. TaxID=1962908 RepID=UPI003568B6CD